MPPASDDALSWFGGELWVERLRPYLDSVPAQIVVDTELDAFVSSFRPNDRFLAMVFHAKLLAKWPHATTSPNRDRYWAEFRGKLAGDYLQTHVLTGPGGCTVMSWHSTLKLASYTRDVMPRMAELDLDIDLSDNRVFDTDLPHIKSFVLKIKRPCVVRLRNCQLELASDEAVNTIAAIARHVTGFVDITANHATSFKPIGRTSLVSTLPGPLRGVLSRLADAGDLEKVIFLDRLVLDSNSWHDVVPDSHQEVRLYHVAFYHNHSTPPPLPLLLQQP